MLMQSEKRFVGINVDVSKAQLEIGILPVEQYWKASNDEAGRQALVERLREIEPTLIVLEATGGYETPLAIHLVAVGLRVVVMSPDQVQNFAKEKGQLSKSSRIDARMLALLAQVIGLQVRPLKDQQSSELDKLFMRRRQIVDMITVEKKRLAQAAKRASNIQPHTAHIVWLEKSLTDVNFRLKTLIDRRHRACARFCVNGVSVKSAEPVLHAHA